jgi:hypothetical protein
MSAISKLFSAKEQADARRKAAKRMGLVKDPTGAKLPDDLWAQALRPAVLVRELMKLAPAQPEAPAIDAEDDDADYHRPDASGYSRADAEWFFDMDGKP